MEKKNRIQVQAVLYRNDQQELIRGLEALNNAAFEAKKNGITVSLRWGDSTDAALLSNQKWNMMQAIGSELEKMEYYPFHENMGYGRGNNMLAAGVTTDYLLIMNPEILLPPTGISDMVEVFQDKDAGIAEARQIPVEHPKEFEAENHKTAWASGACFMIPTLLFHELNGFDAKTFFMYCEDVDLSWRVRMRGKKIIYQPKTGVFHAKRLSGSGNYQPGKIEQKYTVLSEALLAYKWSYPEYARDRIRIASERKYPGGQEAADIFHQLEENGDLPDFMDPEHRIANIIQFPETGGMIFAKHRYPL